jgi:hypothetical protein
MPLSSNVPMRCKDTNSDNTSNIDFFDLSNQDMLLKEYI